VRTPMQWSSDKNAGFSRANPQSLYLPIILDPAYHYEACNVEEQLANQHSLLWWMRRMLLLRKRWRALGEGKCEFLQPDNNKILSYVLRHENEIVLVVANLSRFTQPVELDLSAFKNLMPVELFGRTKFPVIADAPYFLTLGPHNFFWFSLETKQRPLAPNTEGGVPLALPSIAIAESWQEIFTGNARVKFEAALPDYLKAQRWFISQAKTIKLATIKECFRVPLPDETAAELALVQVDYVDAVSELYAVPLAFATGDAASPLRAIGAAELTLPDAAQSGVIYEAFATPAFARALIELISRRERLHNEQGELEASRTSALRQILNGAPLPDPVLHNTPDGNAAVIFGDRIFLKFFRCVGPGVNPELEIGRFLTEKNFPHSPALLGALEYHNDAKTQMTLAVAKAFVPHAKNAWKFTLDAISSYYDGVFASAAQGQVPPPAPPAHPPKLPHQNVTADAADHVGTYLESARLLGVRTAELHLCLASGEAGGEFSTETMTPHHLRGVYQSMRSLAVQNLRQLRKQMKSLPPELMAVAHRVVESEAAILVHYRHLIERNFLARRIRIHGDLHLGQVLWTGRDFVFLDFEGDMTTPISERRIKRSPLRDVARMVRSFHHAAYAGFHRQVELGVISRENLPKFEPWVRHWNLAVSRAFLQAYCQGMEKSEILPSDPEQLRTMLLAYLLNHVMDELGDELRRGSESVRAPLQAIVYLMEEARPPSTIDIPPSTAL
jgi:maltose alpha-D-glucosyltransferase/alpha-amylase